MAFLEVPQVSILHSGNHTSNTIHNFSWYTCNYKTNHSF